MNMFTFRLIDRVRKTVRGSADDIGWLQRDPTMPSVEDGTERFMEILGDIRYNFLFYCAYNFYRVNTNTDYGVYSADRHGVHRLPNSMVCLLVPGIVSLHQNKIFVILKPGYDLRE